MAEASIATVAATRPLTPFPDTSLTNAAGVRPGELLLVLAALTSTWTGVDLLGYKLSDVLLGLSMVACLGLIVQPKGRRVPWWIVFATAAILLVLLLQTVIPTGWQYLASRHEILSYNGGRALAAESQIAVAFQWLVALLMLPLLTVASARGRPRFIPVMITAWAVGACVSAAVSISDYLDLSSVGPQLLGFASAASRQNGLASHANNLGLACTLAVPVAVWLLSRRWQFGLPMLLLLVAGALLSGSRGAQAGVVLAFILTLAISWKRTRHVLVPVAGLMALTATLFMLLNVRAADSLSPLLRFGSAPKSDNAREIVAEQALNDFLHRPLDGVGFSVITSALNIYLQILAVGGLLLAAGMFVYWSGALVTALNLHRAGDPIAGHLACSMVVWLVIGVFENQLTDRYLYFPIAAIAALGLHSAYRRHSLNSASKVH